MARYIENLNSCTDPTSGDYLWIVDASAGATDKDRKVDAGLFAQKALANTFTIGQTIQGNVNATDADLGASGGRVLMAGANVNASTPCPGAIELRRADGGRNHLYADNSGVIRTIMGGPVSNANFATGTVVGAQTSSLDSKDLLDGVTGIEDVLDAVQRGAEAVRRFTYKSGAFNGEQFEGVVVDYAPRYGMDRDAEHEAGKSLNSIVAIGDLLRTTAWLIEKVKTLESQVAKYASSANA